MKNLLAITSLLVSINAFAEMKSLSEYMDERPNITQKEILYVQLRCLGFHKAYINILEGNTGKGAEELLKKMQNRYIIMDGDYRLMYFSVFPDTKISVEEFNKDFEEKISALEIKYLAIADENYLNTGTYFQDSEFLKSE